MAALLLFLSLACGPAPATPAPPTCSPDLQRTGPASSSLARGREALEAGDHDAAYEHLLYALVAEADPPQGIAALLLRNAAADPDAQRLWAHDWAALVADERGRFKIPRRLAPFWPADDSFPRRVAVARAAAVQALERFARKRHAAKRPADHLVGEWAEELGRGLAAPSPALRARYSASFPPGPAVEASLEKATLKELQRLIRASLGEGRPATALRAARLLNGLVRQASFEKLEGPPAPALGKAATAAAEGMAAARRALGTRLRVWTLEELEGLDWTGQRRFTLEHASPGNPGITSSPRGWYRVESTCGWETLYGAATTVELHHARLVHWYGQDPFVGRPGTLRLVPESFGLEEEGAPFWWVGGFQGGDTTTLKFTCGTIPGLGRGITHELTHRFDGAVYGGLPAWLSEGRAVWTASAYGSMRDEDFVPDHVEFGSFPATLRLGYGRREELEKLIAGTIEEYRDNYTAGYALWVYLHTWRGPDADPEADPDAETVPPWEERPPLYADRLDAFMRGEERRKGKPVAVFADHFADGEDGRPDGMEAFTKDWRAFLEGFRWRHPAPWLKHYSIELPSTDHAVTVHDEPTWTWLRRRAEPWFGQDQARIAGELFAEEGRKAQAAVALQWSLAVDEASIATVHQLARLEEDLGAADAAWVLRHAPRYDAPVLHGRHGTPAPFLDQLPELPALARAWADAARSYAAKGALRAARAMLAEHDRLAARLGLPALAPTALSSAPIPRLEPDADLPSTTSPPLLHPFDPPPHRLGSRGWGEEGLTGHEKERIPGLWCEDRVGDLHLGRKEPRGGTGTMDREVFRRDAFVLGKEWMDPGRYVLHTRIEFTTSFTSGGIVLGWTRRDRNVRFSFSGGDWSHSVDPPPGGARESLHAISWSLDGLYTRRSAQGGSAGFGTGKKSFDVELRVDGPTVEAWVEGRRVGVLSTVDGRPIVGRIGFWADTGTYRAIAPMVQRLDRSAWRPGAEAWGWGLSLRSPGAEDWQELRERPVTGLPIASSGSLVLWFPSPAAGTDAEQWLAAARDRSARIAERLIREGASQSLLVILPAEVPEHVTEDFLPAEVEGPPGGWRLLRHERGSALRPPPRGGDSAPAELVFVDPAGILRWASPAASLRRSLPVPLRELMERYEDHRRRGVAGAQE